MKPYVQYIALIFLAFIFFFVFSAIIISLLCCHRVEFGRFGFGLKCFSFFLLLVIARNSFVERRKSFPGGLRHPEIERIDREVGRV